jgi:hydrogenase/urease accessory protein HupE
MENSDNSIDIIYKKPLEDSKAKGIDIRFPQQCKKTKESIIDVVNGFIIEKYPMWCGESGLSHSRIWVDGLVTSDKGILIRYEKDKKVNKALLRASTPFINIDHKNSRFKIAIDYIKLGVVHILNGTDHLLFVLSLMLLVTNIKVLLYAISAFTLSHSISLACGIFGILNVPSLYVEAMIALSIVFLARDLAVGVGDSFTKKHLAWVAFIFGLLHGLGFSNVLTQIGLPQNEIPLALFSFNVGIELGQLFFIACMGVVFFIINRVLKAYKERAYKVISYLIGVTATFWLIERILLF